MALRTARLLATTLGCALWAATPSLAQGHAPGGPPGSPSGGGQGNPGGPSAPGNGSPNGMGQPGLGGGNNDGRGGIPPSANSGRGGDHAGGMAGSLQTGPIGRWWDDKNYSKALGLRPEQKKRMDAIFNENRADLTQRYQALREQESQLEAATRTAHLGQESIFGQIDRVAQARDALEKVNTKLLTDLRKELDADQAARLDTLK